MTVVATPNELYVEPFRTGCKSFYTVDIDDLAASSFLSSNDDDGENENPNDRRSLLASGTATEEASLLFLRFLNDDPGDDENGYGCAEFCVPHLLVPFVRSVLRKKKVPIDKGRCSDHGYSTHVLDKTFSAFSYSLDVELYGADSGNENGNKNNNAR